MLTFLLQKHLKVVACRVNRIPYCTTSPQESTPSLQGTHIKFRPLIVLKYHVTFHFYPQNWVTHQVRGRTNTSLKSRRVSTGSDWIVTFMWRPVYGGLSCNWDTLIRTKAAQHPHISMSFFVREHNAAYLRWSNSCQSARRSTLMENTDVSSLPGSFVSRNMCESA